MQMNPLETGRLRLRMFTKEDVASYTDFCSDPEVTHSLGYTKALSRTDAWRHIAIYLGTWELRGYGSWAVEEKASGRFIGRVGYIHPEGWPGIELAWMLGRPFWGKGFATEAAKAALAHGFNEFQFTHVIHLIRPDNLPSIRVAERIGARREGSMELFGKPTLIYGVEKSGKRG